jgi:hypothetical protein
VKLLEICETAAASCKYSTSAKDILDNLAVIRGRNYWDKAEAGWYYSPSGNPVRLDTEANFEDSFMRIEHIGHYPVWLLLFSEDEEKLVGEILGESGYFNPFTTHTAAFRMGHLSEFQCFYTDVEGNEVPFSKFSQLEDPSSFSHDYPNRRLAWC